MTKKAFQSFAKDGTDGMPIVVSEDDLYADDHPYVLAWPNMFGEHMDLVTVRRAVEQATAAPGELRRGPGRPPKGSL